MPQKLITISRKKYAVGMFWQPLAAGTDARTYARTMANAIDKKLNLFAQYRGMVGLGDGRAGQRRGMPAGAPEVAAAFAEYASFLAVFALAGGYWLVAARNGVILADEWFGDENAARAEYAKLSAMPDWIALFAPNAWGMPRAIGKEAADVVKGLARAPLHPISAASGRFAATLLAVLFALALAWFFRGPIANIFAPKPNVANIENKNAADEYRRRIEQKRQELDAQQAAAIAAAPPPPVMPFDAIPDPAARADACYRAIAFLMQPVSGWVQTAAACDESHAIATFRRDFGNLDDFYAIATELMPGAYVTELSESELSVRAKLPELAAIPSRDEYDADTVLREVNTRFQRINTPVDANIVIETVGDGMAAVNIPALEIAASSKMTPMEFNRIFEGFGGVRLLNIAWDARSRTWNYEVIIYAK